jgi:hypothetical protein
MRGLAFGRSAAEVATNLGVASAFTTEPRRPAAAP